ncbi:MAG: PAS domain-containing protein [Deltaproteobacteria bacterium]|nr:PAS domain-containing protein [Deltaproteobacteria bacterium]
MKQLVEVEAEYRDRLSFVYLDALRPNELGPAVGQLPKDSAILLLTYLRDRDGTSYPFTRAPEIIRNHSNAPVYTLWGDFVVDGVMGGLVISGQQQGALAVNWVLQLFSGIAIDKLPPPQASPNSFLFNYQELQRLGLSVAQLPDGSVVVNEPQTFYYRYRTGVWVVTTLFGWLMLSVLFLTRANFLRSQAAQAIQVEKKFTETVLDAIAVPLFYRDTDGVYLGTNNAGVEFFGFDKNKQDMIGKTSHDLFPKEVADKASAADQQLIANGGTQSYESVMINGAGESRYVLFNKALFLDSQSTVAGIVGTMLDITELKQAQQLASRWLHSRRTQ